MEKVIPTTVVVIVGHWNPSIFTVEWAKQFLFPDSENLKGQLSVEKHYALKLTTDKIEIYVNEITVRISILVKYTDELFEQCEEILFKLCDYLSHTPVQAFGINFSIYPKTEDVKTPKDLLQFADTSDLQSFGLENCNSVKLMRQYKSDKKDLNINIETYEKDLLKFLVNHHFNVKSMTEIKSILTEKNIIELKKESNNILSSVYKLSI